MNGGINMMSELEDNYHVPVMPVEVEALVCPAPGKLILDGTLGGGGHSEIFLRAGASVLALDRDGEALEYSRRRLAPYGDAVVFAHANFADVGEVMDKMGVSALGGALIDLGVSSHQLDTDERGFSFQREGPLDMRMNRDGDEVSAAVLVNTASEGELVRIFLDLGEEPRARKIAAAIVKRRARLPFFSTSDLADVVEKAAPRTSARHPATRVFQALRIATNDELASLRRGLEAISSRLAAGARFAVITFHSLEDRIVKHYFRDRSTPMLDRPEWPEPRPNPDCIFKLVTSKPVEASQIEVEANPRARSAKLRAVERII